MKWLSIIDLKKRTIIKNIYVSKDRKGELRKGERETGDRGNRTTVKVQENILNTS